MSRRGSPCARPQPRASGAHRAHAMRSPADRHSRRCRRACQPRPIAVHRSADEVAVRLAAPGPVALAVVRARRLSAWPMTSPSRSRTRHEPQRQLDRGRELARVAEDLGVARADVLDADRRPVEADGVAAADAEPDELVDRAVAVDDEVGAHAGHLVQLRIGRVRREGRPRRGERVACRVVLDDDAGMGQAPGAVAVVPGRVGGRLGEPGAVIGTGFQTMGGFAGVATLDCRLAHRGTSRPASAACAPRARP